MSKVKKLLLVQSKVKESEGTDRHNHREINGSSNFPGTRTVECFVIKEGIKEEVRLNSLVTILSATLTQ